MASKPYFRQAFQTKRCLVLTDGFYEWQRTGKGKVPYRIALKTGEPFAFAGIWSMGQDGQRRPWSSFAILTTEANRLVAHIHNRMPVILHPEDEATWLNPEASPAQPGLPEAFSGASAAHRGGVAQSELTLPITAQSFCNAWTRPREHHAKQETEAEAGLLFPDPAPV